MIRPESETAKEMQPEHFRRLSRECESMCRLLQALSERVGTAITNGFDFIGEDRDGLSQHMRLMEQGMGDAMAWSEDAANHQVDYRDLDNRYSSANEFYVRLDKALGPFRFSKQE